MHYEIRQRKTKQQNQKNNWKSTRHLFLTNSNISPDYGTQLFGELKETLKKDDIHHKYIAILMSILFTLLHFASPWKRHL